MLLLPYIIMCTYNDIAHIGDISDQSHIVMRFITSHIAFEANARANCWELHFDNVLARRFIVHSHFLLYHHLLDHREMSISGVWYKYSFKYDFLYCWVLVIPYWTIWLRAWAQFWYHIVATLWINLGYCFIMIDLCCPNGRLLELFCGLT